MLEKTRGIVLRSTSYSDTSVIVKIYTEDFGVLSFLVKGAKRKNASIKANLFGPLSMLDLSIYKKEKKNLQILKEATIETHFVSISADPAKTSILFFLNEVLIKCLQDDEVNIELFNFLHESLTALETAEKQFSNFYLVFLVRLSRFLGFYPQGKYINEKTFFDMQDGLFTQTEPMHPDFLENEKCLLLNKLLTNNYYTMERLILSASEKKELLDILLRFYSLHQSNMNNIVSHKILEQVFA